MGWEIVILIVALAIAIGITIGVIHETDGGVFCASFCATMFYILSFLTLLDLLGADKDVPTAKDVYRDRTTLEITYKIKDGDTIKIDTTVVYKDEFKK